MSRQPPPLSTQYSSSSSVNDLGEAQLQFMNRHSPSTRGLFRKQSAQNTGDSDNNVDYLANNSSDEIDDEYYSTDESASVDDENSSLDDPDMTDAIRALKNSLPDDVRRKIPSPRKIGNGEDFEGKTNKKVIKRNASISISRTNSIGSNYNKSNSNSNSNDLPPAQKTNKISPRRAPPPPSASAMGGSKTYGSTAHLSNSSSFGSSVGSEIPEVVSSPPPGIIEDTIREDLDPSNTDPGTFDSNLEHDARVEGEMPLKGGGRRVGSPNQTVSPLLTKPPRSSVMNRSSNNGNTNTNSNSDGGSLPPPPPPPPLNDGSNNNNNNNNNNNLKKPDHFYRSISTDGGDDYSSDSDHYNDNDHDSSPQQQHLSPSSSTLSVSSEAGSFGRHLVKSSLTRPHPQGAMISKREYVKKGKWTLGDKIGKGSFGTVYMGMNTRSGSMMAVKSLNVLNCAANQIEELQGEIDTMRRLTHPNIVRYFGAEVDETEGVLYIFQEWCPGGSVSDLMKKFGRFNENVTRMYLLQILKGLEYLHSKNVVHRDIKGANLLVDSFGSVKLGDFGASKQLGKEGTMNGGNDMSMKGTPYFMAPEVLQHEQYGRKADIWSTGGVAYQMITGEPPWKSLGHKTQYLLWHHISITKDPPPIPDYVPTLLRELIIKCFRRDPKKRPLASELINDPFFTEYDSDDESGLDDTFKKSGNSSSANQSSSRKNKDKKKAQKGDFHLTPKFDVESARKRAELKSQSANRGLGGDVKKTHSPMAHEIADAAENATRLNNFLPGSKHQKSTPILPATDRKEPIDFYKREQLQLQLQRPKTQAGTSSPPSPDRRQNRQQILQRPNTTMAGRADSSSPEFSTANSNVNQEDWPAWAKDRALQVLRGSVDSGDPPGPPIDTPVSAYYTPLTNVHNNFVNEESNINSNSNNTDNNPFRRQRSTSSSNNYSPENRSIGGNPFQRKRGATAPNIQQTATPTNRLHHVLEQNENPFARRQNSMPGPSVAQYQSDSSISPTRRKGGVGSVSGGFKGGAAAAGGGVDKGEDEGEGEGEGEGEEKWICQSCKWENVDFTLPYCTNCAKLRSTNVEGGSREERAVNYGGDAWNTLSSLGSTGRMSGGGTSRGDKSIKRVARLGMTNPNSSSRTGGGGGGHNVKRTFSG